MADSLPDMLKTLEKVYPSKPSWPFRTESARTVWSSVEQQIEKHPTWPLQLSVREGFFSSGIPAAELTIDDFNVISLAAKWKYAVVRLKHPELKKDKFGNNLLPPPTPFPNTKA